MRYHGTGAYKPILLLAHIDVVEAKREDWSMDPFQLIEKDGHFYGRGTSDDKAQAAIWVANLIRYKQEGFRPDRDLIVALTADEEGGGPYNGVDWLLKNHRDLIDSDFALNEGGKGEMINGGSVPAARCKCRRTAGCSGRAHHQLPRGHRPSSIPIQPHRPDPDAREP
jgi:acetylornithine deacetylase/succinyl-diaminopimelate desuccinylase-like protein